MKKCILIVNQSAGYLAVDIANAFTTSGKYEKVVLATGTPTENLIGLNSSVSIQHIQRYNTNGTLSRFVTWMIAFFQILMLSKTKFRKYHLFLVSNPPINSFLHLFCDNDYATLIYDVYPDGLGNFVSKSSLIFRLWTKNNISFFKKAGRVFTLTESMKHTLAQYCPTDKIEVVPVWASDKIKKPDTSSPNLFIKSYPELSNKFIVMYSGNIGLDHDLQCLVDAIPLCRNKEIVLTFIGEGYNKRPLMDYVIEMQLQDRCFFYPFQSIEMLPYSLSSASIGVVATKPNGRSSSIPSKAFNLIQFQIPLLAIAHPESEISLLVKRHCIGASFMTNQAKEIASFLDSASMNKAILSKYIENENACAHCYSNKLAFKFT